MTRIALGALTALLLSTSAIAASQDDGDDVDESAEEPPASPAPPPASPTPPPAAAPTNDDGARRRRLIAAMVGLETVSASGTKLTATMGGIDAHFGTQISDTIGVYVPLHLSLGVFPSLGTVAGIPAGLTGTFAATVVVDATFADVFFVGGGAGLGILNNPIGPAVHLRTGGYPLSGRAEGTNRRKGLAIALDLRLIFAKGITGTYPALSVGYASF